MKLRNKKTGNVFDVAFHSSYKDGKIAIGVEVDADPKYPKCNFCEYESLKEFCENWEDYKPTESLIKDEKIRKAVRAWAEASEVNPQEIKASIGTRFTEFIGWRKDETDGIGIEFRNPAGIENIADGEPYTLAELCGEEEEE